MRYLFVSFSVEGRWDLMGGYIPVFKSVFVMLLGHSRLDRPKEKFCWVYVCFPTNPPPFTVCKKVYCVDLKKISQKV